MDNSELMHLLHKFEHHLNDIKRISYERDLTDDDIRCLNWIMRNIQRIKDNDVQSLKWDDVNKEILIIKN